MLLAKIKNKLKNMHGKVSVAVSEGIILVNLCPHPIYDVTSGITIAEATEPLRVVSTTSLYKKLGGICLFQTTITIPKDRLPPKIEGVYYIISALTAKHLPKNRDDFIVPGNPVRNNKGEVIGCYGFRVPDRA